MTYNANEGTEFIPLSNPAAYGGLPGAVSATWQEVQSSNIPARTKALAKEIARNHPDLVGLQEATVYTFAPPAGGKPTVTDSLALLLHDLKSLGEHYTAVVVSPTAKFPPLPDSGGDMITFMEENVILARTDLPKGRFEVSNVQTGTFRAFVPFLGLRLTRSWASADVTWRGQTFRFIDTHLDSLSNAVQRAQAQELLAGPAKTALPVVIALDSNANAADPTSDTYATYSTLIGGGFQDAWSQTHPDALGLTWGPTAPDGPALRLQERLDLILYRGGFKAREGHRVGIQLRERTHTSPPLWPSDHLGVAATLTLRA
jgi:endonuclease/exonuclease/phosphatase family metal-dependent hydrolase